MGMGVDGLGVSSCSLAMSSARKRVRPGGNVWSLPNSSFTSNLTCFFLGGFSSVGVRASYHYALLLDLWDLSCRWRSSMEWLSHSLVEWDCGGLGEGNWCQLGHWEEGLYSYSPVWKKLPYWRVTNSSILENMMSILVRLTEQPESMPPFKLVLDKQPLAYSF